MRQPLRLEVAGLRYPAVVPQKSYFPLSLNIQTLTFLAPWHGAQICRLHRTHSHWIQHKGTSGVGGTCVHPEILPAGQDLTLTAVLAEKQACYRDLSRAGFLPFFPLLAVFYLYKGLLFFSTSSGATRAMGTRGMISSSCGWRKESSDSTRSNTKRLLSPPHKGQDTHTGCLVIFQIHISPGVREVIQ